MPQKPTREEQQIAREAFAEILPQADMLGLAFYARLFEMDPQLRELFKVDLQDQGHTLMTMLKLCIDGLDERAELLYGLRNLGARHVGYGVKIVDYQTVAGALSWTMQQGLGEKWNPQTESALRAVFTMFFEEMQRGAAAIP